MKSTRHPTWSGESTPLGKCPRARPLAAGRRDRPCLGFAEQLGQEFLKLLERSLDMRQIAMKLAVGHASESPFNTELLEEGRAILFYALELAGTKLPVSRFT